MPRRPFGAPAAIHPIAFCAHTVQRVLYAMFRSKQLQLYSCRKSYPKPVRTRAVHCAIL